ncbi:MAG: hypothetical protein HZC01_03780 [Candidatus Kerfeldbacteria bacterium]|nr:hypothetical protein [Candidatus Kerfeldbacteria bacterium]
MSDSTLQYLSVDLCVISHEQCIDPLPSQASTIDQEHLIALIHADTQACALIQLPPKTIKKLSQIQLGHIHADTLLDEMMMLIPAQRPTLDGIYLSNSNGCLIAELGFKNNGSPTEYVALPQIDAALCTALILDHMFSEGFPLFVEYSILNGALYRDIQNLYQYTESVARLTFVPRK